MDLSEVFRSKREYSEDFFVLLPCFGKRAVLEWFMKEGMIASKRVCPVCGCDMQLKERERDEWMVLNCCVRNRER